MNRIFHVRITWYQYFNLILLGLVAFFFLWEKIIIIAALFMLLIVFCIERFIHTTYTITKDGNLVIYKGRFAKSRTISIKDIISVQKKHSMKFGSFSFTNYILIEYAPEKYLAVLPVKEKEFMELLSVYQI